MGQTAPDGSDGPSEPDWGQTAETLRRVPDGARLFWCQRGQTVPYEPSGGLGRQGPGAGVPSDGALWVPCSWLPDCGTRLVARAARRRQTAHSARRCLGARLFQRVPEGARRCHTGASGAL